MVWSIHAFSGLSPRMRGNRRGRFSGRHHVGSIPAHAGEPIRFIGFEYMAGVYPRACGGTSKRSTLCAILQGLSPRMRGNRTVSVDEPDGTGSIPAHAGEPSSTRRSPRSNRVYPRACGGTEDWWAVQWTLTGLSPRMRGNRAHGHDGVQAGGSIPAHAGEPSVVSVPPALIWVYPRACGGTRTWMLACSAPTGLSPRMRGNLRRWGRPPPRSWSIPAHAGEPRRRHCRSRCQGVYPRACGGTRGIPPAACREMGLSPRMRGNPLAHSTRRSGAGSIPAHAGEPRSGPGRCRQTRVYPRACGGTCCP